MNVDVSSDVLAAWSSVFPDSGQEVGWQPTWFEETQGFLVVYCVNQAWKTQLRALAPKLTERLNAALPTPRIKRVVAAIWEVRVLVTGSRSWTDDQVVADALLNAWHDTVQIISPDACLTVVHGDCPTGADRIAKDWATANKVLHEPHSADWSAPCSEDCPSTPHRKVSSRHGEYCPRAGHRRNQFMVDLGADLLLAFRRNNSRGTTDCINRAKRAGIPTLIFEEQA